MEPEVVELTDEENEEVALSKANLDMGDQNIEVFNKTTKVWGLLKLQANGCQDHTSVNERK